MSTLPPTERFSERASYYARSRPHYPEAILHFLRSQLHLKDGCAIADIGSGTGLLTELLLQIGNPVYAVEPNAPMRAIAEKDSSNHPAFRSVNAAAEATSLPDASVDLVAAGQAFHWFDRPKAKIEFARILRPGGWVALIWNERRTTGTPLSHAYEAFARAFETERFQHRHQVLTSGERLPFIEFFAPEKFEVAEFENHQSLDLATFTGRILSSSSMPLPGNPRYEAMKERMLRIFATHQSNGMVRMEYDTRVYYGRLAPKAG